jgi:hypothetical protein
MEQAMGAGLPEPNTVMPEEIELEMARLAAMASEIVLGQSRTEVAAQQAQQAAQDPITQIQQQELQIKQAEVQRKMQKDVLDATAKLDQLELENKRIDTQARLDGARLGVEIAKNKSEAEKRTIMDGIKTGLEVAREVKNQPQRGTE